MRIHLLIHRLTLFCFLAFVAARAFAAAPHIVLFIADDFSARDCGPYGAKDVRTPNIDRLAREGLTFRNAFAASATCTPSRCAMLTAQMPIKNGAHSNHSLIKEGVETLPTTLKKRGYRVVIAGKTHFGPRDQFPFEYLTDSNIMPPGKRHVLWTDLNTAVVDKLLASHNTNQPLCLIVAAHSPHVYWKDNDGYDPARLTLPPFLLDTPETREALCRYYSDVTWMDSQLGEVAASLQTHGFANQTLFIFTADQGAQWPFAKWNLYDEGIRVPFIVRWPGKTKPAATIDAMISLVDLLPTFVEAAAGHPSPNWDGRSFLPVLLGKTNQHRSEIFATHTGDKEMNRTPMRALRTAKFKYIHNLLPEATYTTHISEGNGPDGRAYWDTWLKLAETNAGAAALIKRYRTRPPEELYDIQNDPFEQTNLASNPNHTTTLQSLRHKLQDWRAEQNDPTNKVLMPEDGRTGAIRYAD